MRQSYRNIVFVGFKPHEREKIKITDIRNLKDKWNTLASFHRFPYVVFVHDVKEALKHQGFAVIIKYNGPFNKEEFCKKYFKSLSRKYYHVITCNEWRENSCSFNIEEIAETKLYNDKFMLEVNSWYYAFLKSEERKKLLEAKIKENPKKGMIATSLKEYMKDKKSVTSKEVANHFNIPLRTAQRYMSYMKELFENVDYDAKTKSWIQK